MLQNNGFNEDLFFKHKIKKLILEKINKSKNYKISIYKYDRSINNMNDNKINYWIEKYDIDDIQYLLKTTGRFLARVIDFLVFFVKCKTVKCNFRVFLSKKFKKKN